MKLHDELINQRIALIPDRSGVDASLDFTANSWPPKRSPGGGSLLQWGTEATMTGNVGRLPLPTDKWGLFMLGLLAVAGAGATAIMAISDAFPEVTPEETAEDIESRIQSLAALPAHLDLVHKALAHSRNTPGVALELVDLKGSRSGISAKEAADLRKSGFVKALAINMTKLKYVGEQGKDPRLGLYTEAKASIYDLVRHEADYERKFYRLGKIRSYSEWLKAGPQKLVEDLADGLDQLAGDIVTGLFVSYNLPIDSGRYYFFGMEDFGCCWICPVAPPLNIDYFNISGVPDIEWSPVDSLHPELKWKAFPGKHRQEQFMEKTGHPAENITYDLRIWDLAGDGDQAGALVYERRKIASTSHKVEDELKPDTRYFWSFRACFDLGQRQACIPWAFSLIPAAQPDFCENIVINPWNYYRFKTPGPREGRP